MFGISTVLRCLVIGGWVGVTVGCAVPQRAGQGKMMRLVEPETSRGYWLYLPKGYSENASADSESQRWPLVVTFHGMKPWDDARPQCREWQEEADRYGFIVCAPELATCNSMMEYPIQKVRPYVQADEVATLAIMDDVLRKTDADPNHVLSTSWSAGGYLAHYLVNQHPERFSCLAVRQSNFSPMIMETRKTTEYADMTVGIFYTENDFLACQQESEAAFAWYQRCGFRNVHAGIIQGMGHERTPETAAAIFAGTCDRTAQTLPKRLIRIQVLARAHHRMPADTDERVADTAISALGDLAESAARDSGKGTHPNAPGILASPLQ